MQNNKLILIVDDEESSRYSLGRLLEREGYQVDCAADGYEALEKLRANKVDMVLSDIKMPGLDGLGLLAQIKAKYPDIYVIMVTAHGEVDIYLESANLGAFDFVHKPVKFEELKLVLKKISVVDL
ncbi:MAG: response regulator [Desulfuromonadaceae bacterium]|nr:response regulator [Desulfuromonadaceae bacterium]